MSPACWQYIDVSNLCSVSLKLRPLAYTPAMHIETKNEIFSVFYEG